MQLYPQEIHAKFLLNHREKSFDEKKTTVKIGSVIFCPTVLDKLFQGLMNPHFFLNSTFSQKNTLNLLFQLVHIITMHIL